MGEGYSIEAEREQIAILWNLNAVSQIICPSVIFASMRI
jgi:hypothetical protein